LPRNPPISCKLPLAGARFRIVGHTDKSGTHEHNQDLSERRARRVAQYLTAHFNVQPARLAVKGMGDRQLRYLDESEEANRLNRRVEVQLLK
jgi:OOP family OmpA-OmpF porin